MITLLWNQHLPHLGKFLAAIAITLVISLASLLATDSGFAANNSNPLSWRSTLESVGLSPEQISLVEDLIYAHQKQEIDLRAQLEKLRLDLNLQIMATPADEEAALKTVDKIGAVESASKRAHIKLLLGIKKILDPKKFDKFMRLSKQLLSEKRRG